MLSVCLSLMASTSSPSVTTTAKFRCFYAHTFLPGTRELICVIALSNECSVVVVVVAVSLHYVIMIRDTPITRVKTKQYTPITHWQFWHFNGSRGDTVAIVYILRR